MIQVDGRAVEVSRPEKPLYPREQITKQDVIQHYQAVADVMLPHLVDRPLVLRRYPDDPPPGVEVAALRRWPGGCGTSTTRSA